MSHLASEGVRLSSKGQIVIPAAVRKRLGLRTGQTLRLRSGDSNEIILSAIDEASAAPAEMLRRIRAWKDPSGTDGVEALHLRRAAEREREKVVRDRRGA